MHRKTILPLPCYPLGEIMNCEITSSPSCPPDVVGLVALPTLSTPGFPTMAWFPFIYHSSIDSHKNTILTGSFLAQKNIVDLFF